MPLKAWIPPSDDPRSLPAPVSTIGGAVCDPVEFISFPCACTVFSAVAMSSEGALNHAQAANLRDLAPGSGRNQSIIECGHARPHPDIVEHHQASIIDEAAPTLDVGPGHLERMIAVDKQ